MNHILDGADAAFDSLRQIGLGPKDLVDVFEESVCHERLLEPCTGIVVCKTGYVTHRCDESSSSNLHNAELNLRRTQR